MTVKNATKELFETLKKIYPQINGSGYLETETTKSILIVFPDGIKKTDYPQDLPNDYKGFPIVYVSGIGHYDIY